MKLIKLNTDHYVIVDDSEIKEGDWCLMFDDFGNLFLGNQPQQYLGEQEGHYLNKGLKKITHSTIPKGIMLMEGIKRLSLQEVKELIGVVDVDKKVEEVYPQTYYSGIHIDGFLKAGYVKGYTQALEDNKEKKYTEEDVICIIQKIARKYFNEGREYKGNMAIAGDPLHGLRSELKKYIQSVQPKTEWEVEFIDGKLTLKNQTT